MKKKWYAVLVVVLMFSLLTAGALASPATVDSIKYIFGCTDTDDESVKDRQV